MKKETKKVDSKGTCRECAHVNFPEGGDVKRGTCQRYPTHTPVALKSHCGEYK